MTAQWTVERTRNHRFPFRIRIEQEGRALLAVRAQHQWPGPGANVFCLREVEHDETEWLEPVERVPVAHVGRIGQKLSVTLDRPSRKRCEFLRIRKPGRNGAPPREQMFFRTETGMRAHRTSGRVELVPERALDVVIDSAERYPWRFPGSRVVKRKLPVGDYAVLDREKILALVERKSLPNLLTDLSQIRGLHQQFAELASYPRAAVVVEAQYGDLGRPEKIGRWPTAHLLRVVGELSALHPTVPLVFAGNRKLANVWTQRLFTAALSAEHQNVPDFVRQAVLQFEPSRDDRLDPRIRRKVLAEFPDAFTIADLRRAFTDAPDARLRRILVGLRNEGHLRSEGRGRAARWLRVSTRDETSRLAAALRGNDA